MAVDQALIDEASQSLGVVQRRELKPGSQKRVFLASDATGRDVILKVIELGGSSPQALQRAVREVNLLQRVVSPHVVKALSDLTELGEPPTGAAWLEEYLDGSDLAACVAPPWSWSEARRLGIEVGRGMGAMHRERVVHRDLSPNNIRRLSAGRFVVMDPGFARHELLAPMTIAGHPGTPGFMSPEHTLSLPLGPSVFSDVFCIGLLMCFCMLGKSPIPFHGDPSEYSQRLRAVSLEGMDLVSAACPRDFVELLVRTMHVQPARRFRNGDALADALEAFQ